MARETHFEHKCLLLVVQLLFTVSCFGSEQVNVALRKKVIGNGKFLPDVVDGDLFTCIDPEVEPWPLWYIDLGDIYLLSSVVLHAQDNPYVGEAGINTPFTVYALSNFTTGCDLEELYPWQPIEKGLVFKNKKERLILKRSIEAQYLLVMPDMNDPSGVAKGIVVAELEAFGTKIRNAHKPIQLDDGPHIPNRYKDIRQLLLSGQSHLWVEASSAGVTPSEKYGDVALVWFEDRIYSMAAERFKTRIIILPGTQGAKRMAFQQDFQNLMKNFKKWLTPKNAQAPIVSVQKDVKPGAILLITAEDQFDVSEIFKKLATGANTAIIGFKDDDNRGTNRVIQLFKELDISFIKFPFTYADAFLPADKSIDSSSHTPLKEHLTNSLDSWYYFNTHDLTESMAESDYELPVLQDLIQKVIRKYHGYFTEHAICDRNPYNIKTKGWFPVKNYNVLLTLQNGDQITTIPGVTRAPGIISSDIQPTCYTVTVEAQVAGGHYPVGSYAKPGEAFRYKIVGQTKGNLTDFAIRVNPQIDLGTTHDSLIRWPIVTMTRSLKMDGKIATPFGGSIVLKVPAGARVSVKFQKVYRYPWFDIRNPNSQKNWERELKQFRGTPYTTIMGDAMISMLPTWSLRGVNASHLAWSVTFFDNVIKMMHNYRGTLYDEAPFEVFVTDVQVFGGWGHSGYPWMAVQQWQQFFLDIDFIKRGACIGIPHEVGHNLQLSSMTLRDGIEVTNNLFIPVVFKYLLKLPTFDWHDVELDRDKEARKELLQLWRGSQYQGVKVSYYNYISRYFSEGLIGNVLSLVSQLKTPIHDEDQKVNFWVSNLCKESGYDLVPFHQLWHFKISPEITEACKPHPCFLPDDDMTKQVAEIVKNILTRYGKSCSRTAPKKTKLKKDLLRGVNQLRKPIISIKNEAC